MVKFPRHDPVEGNHNEDVEDHEGEGKDSEGDVTEGVLLRQRQESQLLVPVRLCRKYLLLVLHDPRTNIK